jgi:hypothetical protein
MARALLAATANGGGLAFELRKAKVIDEAEKKIRDCMVW